MPNKTISLPDEVMPIIDTLDQPFSNWVRDELLKRGERDDDRWERIDALARDLAGEVDWPSVRELRSGGDDVR
ncbi:MAG: hypothetical protein GWN79_24640 [Actinobacteria bacterium]|nr:hypothetical protein [Actinomycetota bacterium]NIU22042.1 hypothetical protein [Actinomycetota bacterium]NIX53408.1 hypothetical protein [Actinomycetota bacterium]